MLDTPSDYVYGLKTNKELIITPSNEDSCYRIGILKQ